MAYLTLNDLTTHIYLEIINEIIRNDATIATKAINAAMGEVKSYLNRFDLVALFGTDTDAPTYNDEYLNSIVKDVACWHILKLANPNIDMAVFRSAYEDAIKFLINIQKGLVDPEYPPKPDTTDNGFDESGTVGWSSNPKRSNYY
ncbi:phage protein Gp36 family protein [Arachidicoccus soli]|uniref:DUF1320 domain-containing protein n=1 Tax=Arachidicoccus soli TaxID=2341117 RepID=A0A386HRW7_9BACT|nr:phage protein Gp36 family protein [Arachidicoccus soli]AYD48210.1 DUF1320 domain-containing protein [Arachidicoccus soli]